MLTETIKGIENFILNKIQAIYDTRIRVTTQNTESMM